MNYYTEDAAIMKIPEKLYIIPRTHGRNENGADLFKASPINTSDEEIEYVLSLKSVTKLLDKPDVIVHVILNKRKLSYDELYKSKSKSRYISLTKQIICYFLSRFTKLKRSTNKGIQGKVGYNYRSQVSEAIRKMNQLLEVDNNFKNYIDSIEHDIQSNIIENK